MNIEELNRKHYLQKDMVHRISLGLGSKLLKFENETLFIELEIRHRWSKSINEAVYLIAHTWRKEHPELYKAIAAKVFIIDSKTFEYKRTLLHLGIQPGYDAKKGVLFQRSNIN